MLEPVERLAFELSDTFPCEADFLADRLQRLWVAGEAEAKPEIPPLPLGKRVQQPPRLLSPLPLLDRVGGVGRCPIFEAVSEFVLAVPAERLVERDGRAGRVECLGDVPRRQPGCRSELVPGWGAALLDREFSRRSAQLLPAFTDVEGQPDRGRLILRGPLHRLPDPPGRVGRELVAAPPVELFGRADEAERALLDQVEERHTLVAVALGDRHDQTQVRADHRVFRLRVAALDPLREHHPLGRCQERVPRQLGQEEGQAVAGKHGLGLADPRLGLLPVRLELVLRHPGGRVCGATLHLAPARRGVRGLTRTWRARAMSRHSWPPHIGQRGNGIAVEIWYPQESQRWSAALDRGAAGLTPPRRRSTPAAARNRCSSRLTVFRMVSLPLSLPDRKPRARAGAGARGRSAQHTLPGRPRRFAQCHPTPASPNGRSRSETAGTTSSPGDYGFRVISPQPV